MSDDLFSPPEPGDNQRLLRVDGDKGLSLAEKLAAGFHRLTYRTALHRLRLRGRYPLKLLAAPVDPVAGDIAVGERILAGRLPHAGHNGSTRTSAFDDPAAPAAWRDWANSFAWLRDLAAASDRNAGATVAEPLVTRWLAEFAEFDEASWRPDLAGARILYWTAYAPYILSSADLVYRSAVLNALARWARHLDRAVEKMPVGLPRLTAVAGLLVAGLLIPGGEARQARGEALLDKALAALLPGDGGIVTRSPRDQLGMLELLLLVRAAYAARHLRVPDELGDAVAALVAALKAMAMGDGAIGAWHGGATIGAARLDGAITAAGSDGRLLRVTGDSGYQRLASGRTLLLLDAGPPPVARVAHHAHAGTLGFELSDGGNRLIVNCGGSDGLPQLLPEELARGLRTTAAHSTLVLADANSTRIRPDGALGRGVEEVTVSRQESEEGAWLDVAHDGYARRFGLRHRRRIFLSANGHDLRGEDSLEAAGPRRARRRRAAAPRYDVRFHLGPGVEATPTADAQGALLKLADGRVWQFRVRGGSLAVDDSIWIDGDGRPRATQQLVVSGAAGDSGVNWSFRRTGK